TSVSPATGISAPGASTSSALESLGHPVGAPAPACSRPTAALDRGGDDRTVVSPALHGNAPDRADQPFAHRARARGAEPRQGEPYPARSGGSLREGARPCRATAGRPGRGGDRPAARVRGEGTASGPQPPGHSGSARP